MNMIYQEPVLTSLDKEVLELISDQRKQLKLYTSNSPRRWMGTLRKTSFARAVRGSNSIEGYNASLEDTVAIIDDEPVLDERSETWLAINGYRDAMTFILQAASDPYFECSKQFLKSLHFMMLKHKLDKNPGKYRPGPISVFDYSIGATVYEAPDFEILDSLIDQLVDYIEDKDTNTPSLVRAAMAHLNLTMIHPFSDGNGRMARALQTLVIAREGIINPVFSSIEEWLGQNTNAYYDKLAITGNGKWNPDGDALPWVRFCLIAHYQQASTLLRRNEEYSDLYTHIEKIIEQHQLQNRMWVALFEAALGLRITNAMYQKAAEIKSQTATRDLRRLCDLELLTAVGEKRGRTYKAGSSIMKIWQKVRISRPLKNPYDVLVELKAPPRLPGI